jgi:hypothetical protein
MAISEYGSGTNVILEVTVPVIAAGTIVSGSYSLLGHDDTPIVSGVALNLLTVVNGDIPIEIVAGYNTVLEDYGREVRTVLVSFIDSTGNTSAGSIKYVVRNGSRLVKFVNSFGTYNELVVVASGLSSAEQWLSLSEAEASKQVNEAWARISRLKLKYTIDVVDQARFTEGLTYYIEDMALITQADWNAFPDHFKRALLQAQIIEALSIANGDPVTEKRRLGIISETIGESKMFFNNRAPLSFGIDATTMEVLKRYFNLTYRLSRG